MIRVIKHGLATTIQDLGRPGYFHLGIPISGAMDRFSAKVANLLVGNDQGAAVLESVFMGPELEFMQDALVSATGADVVVKVDNEEHPAWTALKVKAGQKLSFGLLKSGARIYIAISGGIQVPEYLGSRSTYVIGALGGVEGGPIKNNDELPLGKPARVAKAGISVSHELRPKLSKPVELRVLPGLYWDRLTHEAQANFFEDEWKAALEIDRMGYRFKGGRKMTFIEREQPFGAGSDPSNIVDSCYPYGSIQVPGGLEPIILHRDAVSGGGYFTIGAVISADMDLIGQMQPNTPTRFIKVNMQQALEARKERKNLLNKVSSFILES